MRHTRTSQAPRSAQLCLTIALLGLWGCGSEPVKAPEPTPPPVVEKPKPVVQPKADLALPPSAYNAQLLKADQLLAQNQWMPASEVMATLPADGMSATDAIYLGYLQARIAYIRGRQAEALALLDTLNDPAMNTAQRYRILNLRRHIVGMSGDYLESARLGDEVLRLALAADAPALKRSVWHDLQRLDTDALEAATQSASDPQWQRWLELALLTRAPLAAQMESLPLWQQNNPQHPAANPLPGGLAYVLGAPDPVKKVALILPLSGRLAPAGRAVRDGYLASYYASHESGGAQYEILVLDQDSLGSSNTAYDTALAQGANIVVGPLSKQAVAELGARQERPIPVLALNRLDDGTAPAQGTSALVQFALAPEDEARDIAEQAFGKGARRALVIRPRGDWGSKVAQALLDRWQQLGGTVADSVAYSGREDYSTTVKDALDIPASESRARAVQEFMGTNIEYNARRRQDIDAIFLLSSNGAEARSLKPLLAFHYAGAVPVYATSSVYGGAPDPRDSDLDGINLVETPWLLGKNPELKQALTQGNTGADSYTRLNALGADAFLVQSQFRQLQGGADALMRGNTGLLSMNPQLHIQRELVLSTFDEGAIKPE